MIHDEFNPQDLIDSNAGKASLLCRCILAGLVEPEVEIVPETQALLARAMVDEIMPMFENPGFMLERRLVRAFEWAVRPDVSPEYGIIMGQTILANIPDGRDFLETEAYRSYMVKFGDIIAGVGASAQQGFDFAKIDGEDA